MVDIALPSQAPKPVGMLVLDVVRDQLFCNISRASVADEGVSEVLSYLVEDLEAQARELSGRAVLVNLQGALPDVLRITDSTRLYADPADVDALFGDLANGYLKNNPKASLPMLPISLSTVCLDRSLAVAPSHVLIIEDNPAESYLILQGFLQHFTGTTFTLANDGDSAIELLHSIGREIPTPDLILLDINIPKRNGLDVLESFRSSSQLSKTPVAMLTGSFRGADFEKALRNGANCYALKASDLNSLSDTIYALSRYCLHPAGCSGLAFLPA